MAENFSNLEKTKKPYQTMAPRGSINSKQDEYKDNQIQAGHSQIVGKSQREKDVSYIGNNDMNHGWLSIKENRCHETMEQYL